MRKKDLQKQMHLMTADQLNELAEAMTTAGIAHAMHGDWRLVFRKLSYKYTVGYLHRVYRMLATMRLHQINLMTEALIKTGEIHVRDNTTTADRVTG